MATEQARPTICPNCDQVYDPTRTTYCDKCGNRFPWAEGATPYAPSGAFVLRLLCGLGAVILFGWVGFSLVTMPNLEGGNTGVFYNLMGWFSIGMALLTLVVIVPNETGVAA